MGFLFGGGSAAPSYQMSPQYSDLALKTVYPKLKEIIDQGGISIDTAGLEREFKENTAANFGNATQRIRSFTAPYGNPTAGNRMATQLAIAQAGEEGRGISGIRTQASQSKIASLSGILGLSAGLEDPALKKYYADMMKYNADQQRDAQSAGMMGNLAGLGMLAFAPALGPAAPVVYGASRAAVAGGRQ